VNALTHADTQRENKGKDAETVRVALKAVTVPLLSIIGAAINAQLAMASPQYFSTLGIVASQHTQKTASDPTFGTLHYPQPTKHS